ncbi:MAG TPA: 50S ribosomal protein L17, partial [Candidatus Binataceae bacterium]|nr:50S ribosomal protein L17 [Candidatus Binataceae bacterium]
MRHMNRGRKLSRTSAHRKALFKNLTLALIEHERIRTTDAKAKDLRHFADRMVTHGKQGDLAARRRAFDFLQSHD